MFVVVDPPSVELQVMDRYCLTFQCRIVWYNSELKAVSMIASHPGPEAAKQARTMILPPQEKNPKQNIFSLDLKFSRPLFHGLGLVTASTVFGLVLVLISGLSVLPCLRPGRAVSGGFK